MKGWDEMVCSSRHMTGSVAWAPRDAGPGHAGWACNRLIGVLCSTGTRARIVYSYLRTGGYSDLRIVHGGYEAVVDAIKPGKLGQHSEQRKRP